MRKEQTDAHAPVKQSSKKSVKQQETKLIARQFEAYNKASKVKAETEHNSKPEPAFEYYYDEYDEYLSS